MTGKTLANELMFCKPPQKYLTFTTFLSSRTGCRGKADFLGNHSAGERTGLLNRIVALRFSLSISLSFTV